MTRTNLFCVSIVASLPLTVSSIALLPNRACAGDIGGAVGGIGGAAGGAVGGLGGAIGGVGGSVGGGVAACLVAA